ncbi:hypothetical protein NP233_g5389 [Leucocoprinus birnbaumii]|uniref:NACHT domain-containing protein n=1 Tax=Leucocoprinus birnbaumii TaxID=56174 RepID=A0AAD5VZ94_9AGAR|nr:hypothetical protein NP233_g5389 [Leucocoprinus birnbaumii]
MALFNQCQTLHQLYGNCYGAFANSRDFVINHPLFLGVSAPDYFMEKLFECTIRGAELDSSARDPPPRCHPGTRIAILKRMELWLRDPRRTKRMLWLVGPAGVGKSAIMQTVAEKECKSSLLAALFFSAPNGRNDPRKVITTLAYQLAARYPPYRDYIRTKIMANPSILEKSIIGQFTEFIVRPFVTQRLFEDTTPVLIFIDGLDECKGQQEQLLLLSLISYFTTRFPDVPLLWIVASRPEAHITHHLSRKRHALFFFKEEVPIDSPEACQDVERFVRVEFAKIRGSSSAIVSHFPNWPCERSLLKLLASAQGLFAYADTATRFIAERDHIKRFQVVLDLIDQPSLFASPASAAPLARLDALYDYIVAQVDPEDLKCAKQIFSLLLFPAGPSSDQTQSVICNWLEITPDILHSALCKLHSVLGIPLPHEPEGRITWYHKSFHDFLQRMQSQLGLPMDATDAAEIYRQHLLNFLSRIPLGEVLLPSILPTFSDRNDSADSFMAPEIPRDALSWPYRTPDQLKKGQGDFAKYLVWVYVDDSGLAGLSASPCTSPDILHAVKVMAGFDFCRGYLCDDIFFKLAEQLQEDRSLLNFPVKAFDLTSINQDDFDVIYTRGGIKRIRNGFPSNNYYDYIMQRWKIKHPESLLRAFIGNRLRGWVDCTPLLPKSGDTNLEHEDYQWFRMHHETSHLYLHYNFSTIYTSLQEQGYVNTFLETGIKILILEESRTLGAIPVGRHKGTAFTALVFHTSKAVALDQGPFSMALLSQYQHHMCRRSTGAFANSRDLVINHPQVFLGSPAPDHFMEKFIEYTIRGAELDSSARDPPPRCHPGTRMSILQRVEHWLRNPCRAKRILWLVGPAGVGKSAIMQTVAENERKSSVLAALFFSGPSGRNDPRRVIPTLAYQLAARYPPYHDYIRTATMADPSILEKSIVGQFTELIVKPFVTLQLFKTTGPVLIFIDGLDECKGQQEQLLLLSLISYFTARFPDVPLLWIVASRPEAHITHHLSRKRLASCFDKEEVPIDSPEACQDVESYLPQRKGFFAYADTATRFIAERDHINRFQLVLKLVNEPASFTSPDSRSQPLARLDILYDYIVAQVDPDDLKHAKQIFSLLLFPASDIDEMTQSIMCNWLEISPDTLHGALCRLHSVLRIPLPHESDKEITWYHKSFYDFLHRMRSRLDLPMDENDAHEMHRRHLIKILNSIPLTDSPTSPEIPSHLLTWPYQTMDEAKKGQEDYSEYLAWINVRYSGLVTSFYDLWAPEILHAVKVIAGFEAPPYYWCHETFSRFTEQLRDDGSLLDLPARIFFLDSIEKHHFDVVFEDEYGTRSEEFTDDDHDYVMKRWNSKLPDVMLEAFIGNRLRGWVNCTTFLQGNDSSEDDDSSDDDNLGPALDYQSAMARRKLNLYLKYDFSTIYATLQEQGYIVK